MLKSLTVQQPFASAIVTGRKKIEYRSWRVSYRGPLAIHAGLSRRYVAESGADESKFAFGAIVGVVRLVDVEGRKGDYEWLLRNAVRLPVPIPLCGRMGLLPLPAAIDRRVRAAVRAIKPTWFDESRQPKLAPTSPQPSRRPAPAHRRARRLARTGTKSKGMPKP